NQIFGNIDFKNLEAMTACTLITKYISSLKAPLINEKTFNNLEIALDNFKINDIKPLKSTEGQGATNETALAKKKISSILAQGLDKPSLDLLQLIIDHFKKVTAHSDKNKMPVVALAICVGPSILAFKNRYNSIQDDIEMMSSQYDTINKITTLLIDLDLPLVA
ncbi:MAG: Rho GTPase-activating protein 42, partial [Paramarteilia canceri]